MPLMIDNYDSFTYNLVQYLGELGAEVRVFRNDRIGLDEIEAMAPEQIVISPGPCTRTAPGYRSMSSSVSEGGSRSWECASATRLSARPMGAVLRGVVGLADSSHALSSWSALPYQC